MQTYIHSLVITMTFVAVGTAVSAQTAPEMRLGGTRARIAVPLRDITDVQGANPITIHGIGLVTGLRGSGDSAKAVREAIANLLKRGSHNRSATDLATGNTAMVLIKATIPAFSKKGLMIDVTVSTINDCTSLHGGMLEPTAMRAVSNLSTTGKVYGIASGRIHVNGASFGNEKAKIVKNHPTVGSVLNGCQLTIAPRSFYLNDEGHLELRFLHPSATSAVSAVDGINKLVGNEGYRAEIVDQYLIRIRFPTAQQTEPSAVRLLHRIGGLPVATGQRARVIIDESTGMILAGEGVRISPCAFAVEDVHITIVSEDVVSQPGPGINNGETAIVDRTSIEVTRSKGDPAVLKGGATVDELVRNLTALNLTAPQLIAVFTKLKKGGFLHAELAYR